MAVKELAPRLKRGPKNDPKAWLIFNRLQALAFFPPEEVPRALERLRRDPTMRVAETVMQRLLVHYVSPKARYPLLMWNKYQDTIDMVNRTSNAAEGFHSRLNKGVSRSTPFYAIVQKIELYSIDCERSRARIQSGRGIDNKDNMKRHRDAMADLRSMRQLLFTTTTFEERYNQIHLNAELDNYIDYDYVENYREDQDEESDEE